jgi:uncharacterized protein YndB with AHSA1/START domain
MFHIRVERLVRKDIDTVFEALSDHAGYDRFAGVTRSVLLEQGNEEKNGVGALRHIVSGVVEFHERIVRFERPTRMGYLIEKARPLPMRHDRGDITLTPKGDGTLVVWESEGHIEIPILGDLVLDRLAESRGAGSFDRFLQSIESA